MATTHPTTVVTMNSPDQGSRGRRLVQSLNPLHTVRSLWRHRHLIGQFAIREVVGRYQGSYLGILWSFITPLVMLVVYTFVFGMVFKSRWTGAGGADVQQSLAQFAVIMFVGLVSFQLFAESVGRAPTLVVSNPNFVKKVVFPLEILPVTVVIGSLFHAAIGYLLVVIAALVFFGTLPWTVVLLPVVVIPLVLTSLGVTWFLASLGAYLRDVGQVVGIALQVLMFCCPVFYSSAAIPPGFREILTLNPLTPAIESIRGCLLFGTLPDPWTLVWLLLGSLLVATLGRAWFEITRKGFADVI